MNVAFADQWALKGNYLANIVLLMKAIRMGVNERDGREKRGKLRVVQAGLVSVL